MNLFGTLLLFAAAIVITVKAYAAQTQEIQSMWELIARVGGAILGASVAVVFHSGDDRPTSLKRFFVSVAFSLATAGTVLGYLQRKYGFTDHLNDWLFVAFLLSMLGYVVTELLYSQAISDLFKRAIDSWKR